MGRKHTVVGAGAAASLEMSWNGDPDLLAGSLSQFAGKPVRNGGFHHLGAGSLEFFLGHFCFFFREGSLRYCQNRKSFSSLVAVFDHLGYLVCIIGDFGEQNDVCPSGNAGMKGQPAHLVAHNFYNEHPAVGGSCGVDTVENIGRDVHSALESKGSVCSPQVIVNGLRQRHHIDPLLAQEIGCFMGPIASQNDQTVKFHLFAGFLHAGQFVYIVFIRHLHQFKGLPGGAQNCTAPGQNP